MATLALKRRTPSLGTLTTTAPLHISTIDTPMPSTSVTNKPASQGASLYHTCRSVLDKLAAVEGMTKYLEMDNICPSQLNLPSTKNDPLSKLWSICSQGAPLCILFNALCPEKPLKVDSDPKLNQLNTCKASVYHFIVACLNQLEFPEEDVFTITDLYKGDTNGFVKVVNTVSKILDRLEATGAISVRSSNRNSDTEGPKDMRCKVIHELLETERKYVQDLETLQNYMRELQNQKILSLDTIHYLFGNLNALVDFQRKFLICLEDMAEKSPSEQRFGQLFIQMESAFAVYEPYCANYYSAQVLVVQEAPKLQKLADILNPIYELPSLLIKPVQRICKYPLLLSELIKSTNKDCPYRAEMEEGLEAIKRVAENVNETQRKHENDQTVLELKKRIDSWKGQPIDSFGQLLLQDKLHMSGKDGDEEHSVFFFEKALLFCIEHKDSPKNKLSKSNTISIKKKRRGSLQRKGQIFTHQITGIQNLSQNGSWILSIERQSPESESILLKFRNEEQLRLWQVTLNKVLATYTAVASSSQAYPTSTLAMHGLQMGNTSFLYEEDEEEYDEFYDEDDDEYHLTRSRSNSVLRSKMTPTSSSEGYKHAKGIPLPGGPPMPGMNLLPLPRISNSTTTLQSSGSPTIDYGLYPVSPPPSHPSSPTNSSRISTGSTGSVHWRRRQGDEISPLTDIATKFMAAGILTPSDEMAQFTLPVGRTQSQSTTITRAPVATRLRSQSSPNIQKGHPIWDSLPQIPITMKRAQADPAHRGKGMRTTTSTPRLSEAAAAQMQPAQMERVISTVPLSSGSLKVKLNYNNDIYVIITPVNISFAQLMERVENKIRPVAQFTEQHILRLKYQDEDGDHITINSDDDIQMAFENRAFNNTVNLFVSV